MTLVTSSNRVNFLLGAARLEMNIVFDSFDALEWKKITVCKKSRIPEKKKTNKNDPTRFAASEKKRKIEE